MHKLISYPLFLRVGWDGLDGSICYLIFKYYNACNSPMLLHALPACDGHVLCAMVDDRVCIKLSTVPDIVLELVHVELVLALPAGFSVLFANSLHLLLNQLIILHPIP